MIKKALSEILKMSTKIILSTSVASWITYGVEEMPESIKNKDRFIFYRREV